MYSRKPKDLTKFIVDMSAQQASHTWMSDDKTRAARFGSSSNVSFEERQKIESKRQHIGAYNSSRTATIATTMRGDVVAATRERQSSLRKRREEASQTSPKKEEGLTSRPLAPPPPPPASPPSRGFYPGFK